MKLLIDTCVGAAVKLELAARGHDVVSVADWPEDPGDEVILRHAYENSRVLVTLDKDFGELAILRGRLHAGIVRLTHFATGDQARVCQHVLSAHRDDLEAGAVITVAEGRVRIRPGGTEREAD